MERNAKTYANRTGNMIKNGYNSTRRGMGQAYGEFQRSSGITKFFVVLLILLIVGILVYWIAHAYETSRYSSKESPYLITTPVNAFKSRIRPKRVPDPTDGMSFSYSLWIYVADWNYRFGEWKNIFVNRNNMGDTRSPGLWLYPKTNSLHARISTHADANEGCDVRNIPLQKWVNIVYVLNNRTVDIYIDGKLERSCVLKGVPILGRGRVRFAEEGGFYGQISKMQYFSRSLKPYEVGQIYSEGPYISRGLSFGMGDDKNDNGDDGDDWNDNSNCDNN